MKIIRDFNTCSPDYKGSVVALGNFDGVHLGHQAILRHCIATAKASGAPAAVLSFEPHPREFFSGKGEKLRITSFRAKVELLAAMGIDALFLVRFNREFSCLSAQTFVADILHRQLAVRHVVTGYNFAFGKDRGGDTVFLQEQAQKLGFGFTACPPVYDADGVAVSSSNIRRLLASGDVKKAALLLGRPYTIEGRVRRGEQRGRTLGYPTANIAVLHIFKPRFGIYAVRATVPPSPLGGGLGWGPTCSIVQDCPPPNLPPNGGGVKETAPPAGRGGYDAVGSLGVKPTFGHYEPLLEVHIFDRNDKLYGQRVRVTFVDFLREEKRFDDVSALQLQMAADCAQAREVLNAHNGLTIPSPLMGEG